VRVLAEAGATVVMTSRDVERGREAVKKLQRESKKNKGRLDVRVMELDLADLESVRRFSEKYGEKGTRLDYLVLNAGKYLMQIEKTKQNMEMMFGTHHVGHFYLTKLLLPTLLQTAVDEFEARVVVTSSAFMIFSPENPDWETYFHPAETGVGKSDFVTAYGVSKLANVLFARELHRRYSNLGLIVSSNHPGSVKTPLLALEPCNYLPGVCFDPADGALANLKGCLDDDVGGKFILPLGIVADDRDIPEIAKNDTLARQLWVLTERKLPKLLGYK
jgi:NAD(P)-dependent dehydrogenase (short-subunit alcohol dehydrogenase family)